MAVELQRILTKLVDNFTDLDRNKDDKINFDEFSNIDLPKLNKQELRAAFDKISKANPADGKDIITEDDMNRSHEETYKDPSNGAIQASKEQQESLKEYMFGNYKELLDLGGGNASNKAVISKDRKNEILSEVAEILGIKRNKECEITVATHRGGIVISVDKGNEEEIKTSEFTFGHIAPNKKLDDATLEQRHYTVEKEPEIKISPIEELEKKLSTLSSIKQEELERWQTRTTDEEKQKITSAINSYLNAYMESSGKDEITVDRLKITSSRDGIEVEVSSKQEPIFKYRQAWVTEENKSPKIEILENKLSK